MEKNKYLQIKQEVLDGSFITNYVAKELGVSVEVARCLVNDWQGEIEPIFENNTNESTFPFLEGPCKRQTFKITDALSKAISVMAVYEDKNISNIVSEAIDRYIPNKYKELVLEHLEQEESSL